MGQKTILINDPSERPEEELDYKALLHKFFLQKWYIYLLCTVLFVGLAYVYANTLQPEYEVTSKLEIREGEDNYGPEEDWLKRSISFSAMSESVSNEIQTLTSFWLMHTVVQDLELDKQYFWKYRFSKIEAYRHFPIRVDTFSLRPADKSTFEVRPVDQSSFVFLQDDEIGTYRFGTLFTNRFGTFKIEKNGPVPVGSDSTLLVEFSNSRAVANGFLKRLNVGLADNKSKSSMLILNLRDVLPARGIDVLNQLVLRYNERKEKENTEITLNTLEFINDRLANIRQELQSVEMSVEQFKLANNITAETTSDIDLVFQNVSNLVEEQKEVDLQISILDSMKTDLQDTTGQFALIPVNLSLVNPQLQQLIEPYNEEVLKRNRLLETGQPSNPVVKSANQRLNSMRLSIFAAIENMQNDLRLKRQVNQSQYQAAKNQLRSVPTKERALLDRLRNQSIKEELYTYLLQKKEETALALVSKYSSSLLVDPPYSDMIPVAPNKKVFYLGGAAAGMAIPFFLLLIIDLFKDSVQTERELKKLIPGQNVMGVIDLHKGKDRQVLLNKDRPLVAERFRSLRTNIQFHHREPSKCILVTSSTCDEGKTFVATNLGTSFAMINKKTIILDFDLRKPDSIELSEDIAELGLSNYLVGEVDLQQIIQTSKEVSNLHFIASGPVLLNSAELLSEAKLDTLFTYLKSKYDIIVVDTPPVGLIADAILLNKHITESLFVVRSGFTKKIMLENAKELFEQEKLVNPSLILNGIRKEAYGYGYGRSYKKYGYVYN